MKKRITIIIKIVSLLIISIVLIVRLFPQSGGYKYGYPYRENALKKWQKLVLTFESTTGHLPHDLYEVYLFYREEINLDEFPIVLYSPLVDRDKELLKSDPSHFLKITYYEYVQERQHWWVKEKYPSGYGSIFSINERGEIKKDKEQHK